MDYRFLLELGLILFFTKAIGLLMKKLGLPQVVGFIIAGLLLGGALWGPLTGGAFVPVRQTEVLSILAEIGVVMILFTAGLETDLKELKKTGLTAAIVAAMGVIVPLGLGIAIAVPFFGIKDFHGILSCVFIGVILTATSVSITVETLRELGKLKGKVGTTILSAAIIDDVIGIIILTVVMGLKNPTEGAPVYMIALNTVLFFICAIGVGIVMNMLFKKLAKKYPKNRRIPIFALAVCFLFSFGAEYFFGIADITGAYLAGIVLSNVKTSGYVGSKIDVNSYMLFSPIFFASIGIKTSFAGIDGFTILFAALFVLAGVFGKIAGCAGAARLTGFNTKDSLKVGIGMIARGEVALIVAQKGIASGVVPSIYLSAVIVLVIISSLAAPIFLKLLYGKDKTNLKINMSAPSVS